MSPLWGLRAELTEAAVEAERKSPFSRANQETFILFGAFFDFFFHIMKHARFKRRACFLIHLNLYPYACVTLRGSSMRKVFSGSTT